MENAVGGIAQLAKELLERGPKVVHAVKRHCQAIMWTDWPDHIRAISRDWMKDILARVFKTRIGDAVPGNLCKIDRSHWVRKQGCALALSTHAGDSTEQYLNCVIVLLAILCETDRHDSLAIVRQQLALGYPHVDNYFLDKKQPEKDQAHREYGAWLDALCEEILHASGLLQLDRVALGIPATEVNHCLMRLLCDTTVRTTDTLMLIEAFHLNPILKRGYLSN
jgi:hypothetical protein